MTGQLRLLIAARPADFSGAPWDAFGERHVAMITSLSTKMHVALVGLRAPHDNATTAAALAGLEYSEVRLPESSRTRGDRARRLVHLTAKRRYEPWEIELLRHARTAGPDAVITVGPWLDFEYRALHGEFPSLHLSEEDLTCMPELFSQSRQARWSRSFERRVEDAVREQPRVVGVLSPNEIPRAERAYRHSKIALLRHSLDPELWPVATACSDGAHVLVVGNLAEGRNADGLADVLREVEARRNPQGLAFALVSGTGLTPELEESLDNQWVRYLGEQADLPELYRTARLALVPARRATGLKTTVLQAWSGGCPVVCFEASADTIGSREGLAAARTPAQVVDEMNRLWTDDRARAELAEDGFGRLQQFDRSITQRRLEEIVRRLAGDETTEQAVCDVAAYLVHWHAPEWCAESVETLRSDVEVTVINNGGTVALPPEVRVVEAHVNLGFAAGANLALNLALSSGCRYVLIGCHDVQALPGCVPGLVAALDRDQGLGIVGPVLNGQGDSEDDLEWISGTAMLIRGEVAAAFRFDERYGSYNEDVDYCLRVGAAGWRVGRAGSAHARSLGSSDPSQADLLMHSNTLVFFWRNRQYRYLGRRVVDLARRGRWRPLVRGAYRIVAFPWQRPDRISRRYLSGEITM